MPYPRRAAAALTLAALLAGCRIDVGQEAAPEGYHQMPDGSLMADVAMETDYAPDINGDGFSLPTHTRPDGTVILGSAPDHASGDHGGHDHAVPSTADFPAGVLPVGLQVPRLELVAPVVATTMDSGAIQGPPVAGDVAWLQQTRKPGEIGPAVLGGVAELGGRAGAFADLDQLAPGDEFLVIGDDEQLLTYVVDSVGWSPVEDRPELFAMGEGRSEVRLVAWAVGDDPPARGDYLVRAYLDEPAA